MAVDLSKLASKRGITLDELSGRIIAIDAYNVLYQFIATIRQPDGTPLMDSNGNVTSHLSGLFYRTIDLLEHGLRPVYVFDGIPSVLKQKALAARLRRREEAHSAWREAMEKGDLELAKTKAQASSTVNREIVKSAKELLSLMGVYHINAPGEGEAQASVMCKERMVDLVGSQDYDTLLLGAPLIARNLTVSGRRKLPGKNIYINVRPELVDLGETLGKLQVTQEQLVWIGMMLGTDFNEGIRGIGPVNALKIARTSASLADVVSTVKKRFNAEFEVEPREIVRMFEEPEVAKVSVAEVEEGLRLRADERALVNFMCKEHGFSEDRISKYSAKLALLKGRQRQQGLGAFVR